MVVPPRFALALSAAVVAMGSTTVAVGASSAASTPLAALLVRASQVGPGYRARQATWARTLPTAQSFTCDHDAAGDRAVQAIGDEYVTDAGGLRLYNVLFEYRAETAAADTVAHLRRILIACPKMKIVITSPREKITLTLSLTRLPIPRGLLPRSVALREIHTETGTRPIQEIDVVQPRGRILSLTYALGSNWRMLRAITTRVARASAANLR